MAEQTSKNVVSRRKSVADNDSPASAKKRSAESEGGSENEPSADQRKISGAVQESEPGMQPEEQEEYADALEEPQLAGTSAAAAGESVPARRKGPIEYDLSHMYPEVNVLVEQKRREWDFQDPAVIRALWLDAKTNALEAWRTRHAQVSRRKKPSLDVQENNAYKLRRQHLETVKERLQTEQVQEERMFNREHPEFAEVKLATNITTQVRYNYTRNNPPVPLYYLTHYRRFKKPPFHTYSIASKSCHLFCREMW